MISIKILFIKATLQFCLVKPPLAIITLILQSEGLYKDGDFRWVISRSAQSFLCWYCNNKSYSLAVQYRSHF